MMSEEFTELSLDNMQKDISLPQLPERYHHALKKIRDERANILAALKHSPPVYGFNRLPGHRDNVAIKDKDIKHFHESFLESHLIGGAPYLSTIEVRYIAYAKLKQLLNGSSGISETTAKSLLNSLDQGSIDGAVIPACDSYSSGDVILGAHLTDHLLRVENITLEKGDLMAMINGSFAQAGIGLSARKSLHELIDLHSETLGAGLTLMDMGIGWFGHVRGKYSEAYMPVLSELNSLYTVYGSKTQVSVSWRSALDTQDMLVKTMNAWENELQATLSSPSGNPLFLNDSCTPASQASFLALGLSLATSQLIEALLFCAGQSVHRCQYILSGVHGIPRDGAYSERSLGLIQVPKSMTAKVLDLHTRYGQRPMAHLASTSYGIEDSCSMGTMMMHYLKDVLKVFIMVVKDESRVYRQLRIMQEVTRK